MTILASQPTNVSNVNDISFVNGNSSTGTAGVTIWGTKYNLVNTTNPFMRFFTGLNPKSPKSQYQVATVPLWPCTSGIQAVGDEIGINIQSSSIKKNFVGRGNLGTIVLGAKIPNKIKAFPTEQTKFKYSFDIKIPSTRTYGNVAAQVAAYIYFVDTKNKRGFWYGTSIFDNRGTDYKDRVMWDIGTKTPIVTAFPGIHTALLHPESNAVFFSKPYSDYKHYDLVIGVDQIKAAINLLSIYDPAVPYSENVADYTVTSTNLNPEIHVPDGFFNYSQIGLSVRNWKLEQLVQ